MTRLLVKKFLRESQLLWLACSVLLVTFIAARIWIVCQFDLQQFRPFLAQLKPFEKFMPVPLEHLLSYTGSIAMTFNEAVLLLPILCWAIARGSDVISGELGRGTLEMLLSQPITRTRLLLTHTGMAVAGLASLCLITWTAFHFAIHSVSIKESITPTASVKVPFLPIRVPLNIGPAEEVMTPLSERVDSSLFVVPCLNLFGLGLIILGLSTLCSASCRFRSRAVGVTLGIYVSQVLLFVLSRASEACKFAENFTVLSLYVPDRIIMIGGRISLAPWSFTTTDAMQQSVWPHSIGPLGVCSIQIVIGVALISAAVVVLRRRDLPAPL